MVRSESEHLSLSERRYQRLFANMMDACVQTSLTGEILDANPAYLAMLGYSLEEMKVLRYQDITPPSWHAFEQDLVHRELLPRGYSEIYEKEYIRKDGSVFPVELRVLLVRNDQGEPEGFWGIARDISRRKLTETNLAVALVEAQRFRHALDRVSAHIYMKDPRSRYVYANRSTLELFGCSAEELVGRDDTHFFPPATVQRLREVDAQVLRGEESTAEIDVPLTDGQFRAYWEVKTPIYAEPDGEEIWGLLGISTDITARKRTELALIDSERFSHATLDALSSHIAILDATGTIVAVNHAWREFAAANPPMSAGACLGENYLAVCEMAEGPDRTEAKATAAGIRAVMDGQTQAFTLEYPCHSPREQRWFNVGVTRFPGEGARHFVVAHENITARKRVEQELRRNFNLLQALINGPHDLVVFSLDTQYRYTSFNAKHAEEMLKVWRRRPEIGISILDLMDLEEVRAIAKISMDRALAGETFTEIQHQTTIDVYYEFLWSPILDLEGNITGITTFIRDVTERRRAEERLRVSEDLLRIAERMATLGGWKMDLATNRVIWSDEVAAIHGMPSGYSPGLDAAMDFYAPEWRPRIQAVFGACVEAGTPFDEEMQILNAKGQRVWVRAIAEPERDAAGTICGAHGAFQDITVAKKTEEEIRLLNIHLEQKVQERTAQLLASNQDLEAFSYSVSHDLRAPLRAIDGFTRILLEDNPDKFDAEGRRVLDIIRINTRQMDQLITDLLELSRIGQRELDRPELDMTALVRSVYGEIASPEVHARVQFQLGDLPSACGDPVLLRQVWNNLISNAIKYSGGGPAPCIEVGGHPEGEEVIYFVRDNGVGFNPAYTNKLFGVFQRLHSSSDFPGTGIGLAIVKRIISRHGGRVWAEGQPGQGATFFFSLPRKGGVS